MLGGAAHGELVEIGLAEDRQAGGAQVRHQRRVIGRHPALKDARGCGGDLTAGDDEVLDGHGHTGHLAHPLAGAARLIGGVRIDQGLGGIDVEEGVHSTVDGGDAIQVSPGQLTGGDLTGGQCRSLLRRRGAQKGVSSHEAESSPRI